MKNLLFICSCLTLFYTHAQLSESEKAEIKKFKKVIDSDLSDTLKIQALKNWNNLTYLFDPELDLKLNLQIDSICSIHLVNEISPAERKFYLNARASATNVVGINYYYTAQYEQAIAYYQASFELYKQLEDLGGQANAINNVGVVYFRMNQYDNAQEYYQKGLELRLEARDTTGIAGSYRNLATIYKNKGDLFTAMAYLNQEKELNRLIQDSLSIATSNLEMGNIYYDLQEYEMASTYLHKAKLILEDLSAVRELTRAYNSIGACYEKSQQLDSAIFFYNKSLELSKTNQDDYYIAMVLNNMGIIKIIQGEKEEGKAMVKESYEIAKKNNNVSGMIAAEITLGEIYLEEFNYREANKLGLDALAAMDTINMDVDAHMDIYQLLYESSKGLHKAAEALAFHEKYILFRDSLLSSSNQKLLLKNEFSNKMKIDSLRALDLLKIKNLELDSQKAENERRRLQTYFLVGGSLILIFFVVIILKRYRLTQKQKLIIQEQKKQVDIAYEQLDEVHTEMKDSIAYAKRIQTAILPPRTQMNQFLPNGFILYLPKDVVAGDFYWMEKVGDTTLFAVADCTGHGVPGAMVSVVCNNALNRAVREFGLTDPAKILDKVREIVIQEFERSEEEVKDGMDIALCSLEKNQLKYAGAHNPLWIIRNNEILETKADKQPIGKFDSATPFTSHTITLKKKDRIYLFSDGFVDQFGGDKGKKFKPKALRNLLLNIHQSPVEEQKTKLEQAFHEWRGDLEQVDDVCVLGLEIRL